MARKDQIIRTVFRGATRKGTSANGNPTWVLHTDAGAYITQTDAQIGYSIGNYIGRTEDSLIGKAVRMTATGAGRVWNIEGDTDA